ncbi:hypothetical protein M404DRAFT_267493 [Pisolithus tinctorius Marx 270]|uniref:Uncharacterized protein n=1 Tax=Pisolithus tinctorius Marx 270 TaxID=870435 RepID=A0A0C3PL77_PISTI|nr:hypothetical protein M404DRAFT_267493 [Pisolithus tinctorius Marx 270]
MKDADCAASIKRRCENSCLRNCGKRRNKPIVDDQTHDAYSADPAIPVGRMIQHGINKISIVQQRRPKKQIVLLISFQSCGGQFERPANSGKSKGTNLQ